MQRLKNDMELSERRMEDKRHYYRGILRRHGITMQKEEFQTRRTILQKGVQKSTNDTDLTGVALFRELMRRNRGKFFVMRVFNKLARDYKERYKNLLSKLMQSEI